MYKRQIPVKVGNSVILANTFNDGTTIASVANMNDLIFRGNIDETAVGSLVTGMPMKITIGALQNLNFEANLEYISPKACLLYTSGRRILQYQQEEIHAFRVPFFRFSW